MTKMQAVRAYLKLYRDAMKLHGDAADHVSRRDNNKVFEQAYEFRYIARRILREYEEK